MASQKLLNAQSDTGEELNMDMSPMIDLVFLLLIFFMVSSHLIIVKIDKRVKPPTASNAEVAKNTQGRIVVNVLNDGRVFDHEKRELVSSDAITEYVDAARQEWMDVNVRPRLHVRADKQADTKFIKKVVTASAEAGVVDVIFGSFVVEKK